MRTASQDRWRALLIGAVSFAFLAGLGFLWLLNKEPDLDQASLCPRNKQLDTSIVVLVDTTDPLTANQSADLMDEIARLSETVPKYSKLTLLFLDAAHPYEPKQLVSLCNPGSGANANPLFHTASRLQARWRASFGEPVVMAAMSLRLAPTSDWSPIMEAITGATWRADFNGRVPHRRLIIISDLLQNDPHDFSTYRHGDLWRRFQHSAVAAAATADLTGTEVQIDLLHRPAVIQFQNEKLNGLWRRWLTEHGASTIEIGSSSSPLGPGESRLALSSG